MTREGVSVSRIQACQEALNPTCTCALKVVERLCILATLEVLRLAQLRVRSGVPERKKAHAQHHHLATNKCLL